MNLTLAMLAMVDLTIFVYDFTKLVEIAIT